MFQNNSWKIHASSWIGVSAAVITAIAFTHSGWCLIALFIPLLISDKPEK